MNPQFKRGIIELCVMSLLAEADMYGYAVIHVLAKHIDVSENTIYPILRRLTEEGFFKTYLKDSSEGPARKYYSMTRRGFEHYLRLRESWDAFIGGVYHIINLGGKKNEDIFGRFAKRIEENDIDND